MQLSTDSSSTETLYCLIIAQWLEVVYKMARFCRFTKVTEEIFDATGFLRSQDEGHLRLHGKTFRIQKCSDSKFPL